MEAVVAVDAVGGGGGGGKGWSATHVKCAFMMPVSSKTMVAV